jgi:hypothetical protein
MYMVASTPISSISSQAAVRAKPRLQLPPTVEAAAKEMRKAVLRHNPQLADFCREIESAGFGFGVRNGFDAVVRRAGSTDSLAGIISGAASFAGRYGFVLGSDQPEAAVIFHSDMADPARLSVDDKICIYTAGQAKGHLTVARALIMDYSRNSRKLDAVFSHHYLDELPCTPFECLSLAFADLGIVREDLGVLNWSTSDSSVRNIRRRVFSADPSLAHKVALAERLLATKQSLSPYYIRTLHDARFGLLEILAEKNLAGLGVIRLLRCPLGSRQQAIEAAFPFIKDPFFDPHEDIFRRCRQRLFDNHAQGAFLLGIYDRLTSPDGQVEPVELTEAQSLCRLSGKELERLNISHHWGEAFEPRLTVKEVFARSVSIFGVVMDEPAPANRYLLELDPDNIGYEYRADRRLVRDAIEQIGAHHPQGGFLFEVFSAVNQKREYGDGEHSLALTILKDVPISDLQSWGVKLPDWVKNELKSAGELMVLAFPYLESGRQPEVKAATLPSEDAAPVPAQVPATKPADLVETDLVGKRAKLTGLLASYPRLSHHVMRKYQGSVPAEIVDNLIGLLDRGRSVLIELFRNELIGLFPGRKAKYVLTRDYVALNSRLVLLYSINLFDDLFGPGWEEQLQSKQSIMQLPLPVQAK